MQESHNLSFHFSPSLPSLSLAERNSVPLRSAYLGGPWVSAQWNLTKLLMLPPNPRTPTPHPSPNPQAPHQKKEGKGKKKREACSHSLMVTQPFLGSELQSPVILFYGHHRLGRGGFGGWASRFVTQRPCHA